MAEPTFPDGDLALLTDALDDPGTDLHDALTMFADHLTAVVPSFLGVTITMILDGVVVTFSAHDSDRARTADASQTLPFAGLVPDVMDSTMMIYAAEVHAFTDLAAVVTRSAGAGERTSPRGNVAPPRSGYSLAVSGLAGFSAHNQAIGVLIDRGYTPDEARIELHRRATRDEVTVDGCHRVRS